MLSHPFAVALPAVLFVQTEVPLFLLPRPVKQDRTPLFLMLSMALAYGESKQA